MFVYYSFPGRKCSQVGAKPMPGTTVEAATKRPRTSRRIKYSYSSSYHLRIDLKLILSSMVAGIAEPLGNA